MVNCAVKYCKHRSGKECSENSISFFRFPDEPKLKLLWVKLMGNSQDWIPTKFARVCSKHFQEETYTLSKGGRRVLKSNAVPNLFLPDNLNVAAKSTQTDITMLDDIDRKPTLISHEPLPSYVFIPLSSLAVGQQLLSPASTITSTNTGTYEEEYILISNQDTTRERKLKYEIRRLSILAKKRQKIIKALHQKNRRHIKRIDELRGTVLAINNIQLAKTS